METTKIDKKPVLLDVTIRDGGYLNNWEFSFEAITSLLKTLDSVGIDIIEVGYISEKKSKPIAYQCSEKYLADLKNLGINAEIAAMLNPKHLDDIEKSLAARQEYLDLIRIPCFIEDIEPAITTAKIANQFGINSSINLISMTAYLQSELVEAVEKIAKEDVTNCLYFADSRGALLPDQAESLYREVRKVWSGNLGFHAHNNLGQAIDNCAAVLGVDCDWIDCSVSGYGLGGGNSDLIETLDLVQKYRPIPSNYRRILQPIYKLFGQEMPAPEEFNHLYKKSGIKNLEQEWVPIIWETYGEKSTEFLDNLPKKLYKHEKEVVG